MDSGEKVEKNIKLRPGRAGGGGGVWGGWVTINLELGEILATVTD